MELDNLAAETAATMTTDHPDYAILAARLAISNLHKETKKHFSGKLNLFFHVFILRLLYLKKKNVTLIGSLYVCLSVSCLSRKPIGT